MGAHTSLERFVGGLKLQQFDHRLRTMWWLCEQLAPEFLCSSTAAIPYQWPRAHSFLLSCPICLLGRRYVYLPAGWLPDHTRLRIYVYDLPTHVVYRLAYTDTP